MPQKRQKNDWQENETRQEAAGPRERLLLSIFLPPSFCPHFCAPIFLLPLYALRPAAIRLRPAGYASTDGVFSRFRFPLSAFRFFRFATARRMQFVEQYLAESQQVAAQLDRQAIAKLVEQLVAVRERGGRLFILGVGGSAANASHAVNDFRKICGFEAYAPSDNVSELTARTNDEGWATVFSEWLKGSRLQARDALLVLSVGGGNLEKNVSANLVAAIQCAKQTGASVLGIVGRDGGYTAKEATACVIVPTVNPEHVTPHAEAFQAVVWHLLVSHPRLKVNRTKWEDTR